MNFSDARPLAEKDLLEAKTKYRSIYFFACVRESEIGLVGPPGVFYLMRKKTKKTETEEKKEKKKKKESEKERKKPSGRLKKSFGRCICLLTITNKLSQSGWLAGWLAGSLFGFWPYGLQLRLS